MDLLVLLSPLSTDIICECSPKGMEAKIARVQECYWLRRKMASFVSQMCEDGHGKNGGKASKLRDAGNAKFAAKEDLDSIRLYTQVLQ